MSVAKAPNSPNLRPISTQSPPNLRPISTQSPRPSSACPSTDDVESAASAQEGPKGLSNIALAPLSAVVDGVKQKSHQDRLDDLLSDDEGATAGQEEAAAEKGPWSGYEVGYNCSAHVGTPAWDECLAARNFHRDRIGFDHELLEEVACTPKLSPGDAVLFLEHVFHRTQDMAARRVAMLINLT